MGARFVPAVGDRAIVSPGGPVDLGQFSEPEPDIRPFGAARFEAHGELAVRLKPAVVLRFS